MKKLLFAIIALLISVPAIAKEEMPIDQSQLPTKAQQFITNYYPQEKVSIATVEKEFLARDYKVILTNGTLLEFDKNGDWTDIECKKINAVPAAVVPVKVAEYVKARFPSNTIQKIERTNKGTDIELDNGYEMEFNKKGNLVEIDL